MEKTRQKTAQAIADGERADRQLRVDDDFNRDELRVKSILDAAKIEGQFMYDVNEQELQGAQFADEISREDQRDAMAAQQQGQDADREDVRLGNELEQSQHAMGMEEANMGLAANQQSLDAKQSK